MAIHSRSSGQLHGLSLCAGYGGLDLGLAIAEPAYRTVCFVEREAHAAATLVARMEDEALDHAPVWDDLRSFDGRPWRGKVHILTAGYPCQPFSMAGKRRGEADPRHLWPEVERIIDEARPGGVFVENVEGHIDLGLADVVGGLRRLGYSAKAGLFTAREVGARHRRRRLFILAYADGVGCGLHAGRADWGWRADDREAVPQGGDQLGAVLPEQCGTGLDEEAATLTGMGWKPVQMPRCSPLVRVSFKFGTGSYIGGLISNPRFFEHAMGWPIGWTAPGEPVTAYAAWLQRSRTELSRLISLREGLP